MVGWADLKITNVDIIITMESHSQEDFTFNVIACHADIDRTIVTAILMVLTIFDD